MLWQHYCTNNSYYFMTWTLITSLDSSLRSKQQRTGSTWPHTIPTCPHHIRTSEFNSSSVSVHQRQRPGSTEGLKAIRDRGARRVHAGREVSWTYHAVTCRGRVEGRGGGGLTIVGVQQGQGALSAPIHPSLRERERRGRGRECERRKLSVKFKRQPKGQRSKSGNIQIGAGRFRVSEVKWEIEHVGVSENGF